MATKKEKDTPKKKNPKKNELTKQKTANPAVPYIIGFFALFIMLTFFLSETGFFGRYIRSTLLGLFGAGYYYFPFLLLIIAFYWRHDKEKGAIRAKIVLAATNFIFLLIIFNTLTADNPKQYGMSLYSLGQTLDGAGLIGGHIGAFFVNMLGKIPTFLLSFLSIFITGVFLFGSTPKATVKAIIDFFKEIDFGADYDNRKKAQAKEKAMQKNDETPFEPEPVEPPTQMQFELPDEEVTVPKTFNKDLIGIKEINRDKPWNGSNKNTGVATDDVVITEEELHLEEQQETAYIFPPMSLLAESDTDGLTLTEKDIHRTSKKLVDTLESFGVRTRIINTSCGPTVTRYELQPESGVRVKSISNLADDISLHLAATSVRIESIPGKAAVGI